MKSYEPQFRLKRIFESLKRKMTATSLPQHWNRAGLRELEALGEALGEVNLVALK